MRVYEPGWRCTRARQGRLVGWISLTSVATKSGMRGNALFGCHIGVMKRIFGGLSGKSSGKDSRALKKPPSLDGWSDGGHPGTTDERHSLNGIWRAEGGVSVRNGCE